MESQNETLDFTRKRRDIAINSLNETIRILQERNAELTQKLNDKVDIYSIEMRDLINTISLN